MKIHSFKMVKSDLRTRIQATVQWEDCQRPDYVLYFETENQFAHALSLDPNAFLLGSAIPAQHYNERRIYVDGEICSELRANLNEALAVIRYWYYKNQDITPLKIEAKKFTSHTHDVTTNRSGFFFSGGIDSFATLRNNRLHNRPSDALYITDGLLVFGLEQDDPDVFGYVAKSLSEVAKDAQLSFIPVYTNVYLIFRNEDAASHFHFWGFEFGGCALAAVAHAFSGYLDYLYIASTCGLSNLAPWGSHPVLDPYYSGCNMRIRHDGITLTRLDKTRLVADWDFALKHLRVCNHYKKYTQDHLNCGKCEKCVRTMLTLEALGKLEQTRVFPTTLTPELVKKGAVIDNDYTLFCYQELFDGLKARKQNKLIKAICYRIEKYHQTNRKPWYKNRFFNSVIKH